MDIKPQREIPFASSYIYVGINGLCPLDPLASDDAGDAWVIMNFHPTLSIIVTVDVVTTGAASSTVPLVHTAAPQSTFFVVCSFHPLAGTFTGLNFVSAAFPSEELAPAEKL